VLARAQELDIEVKTASSGLDEGAAALVRMSFDDTTETPEEIESAPVTPPVAEDDVNDSGTLAPEEEKVLLVEPGVTVHDLARLLKIRTAEIVKTLMFMGEMVPGGGEIPVDAIERLGQELGWEILVAESDEEEEEDTGRERFIVEYEDDPESLVTRIPVVAVMGHVDHGKTQLLDTIRNTNVIEGEAGRITQHIGAYQAEHDGSKITFIDTPGHEAFTALRARGAEVTDIAIIVIAADDSVMPQTVEAINHAKAADVPIIIAINKMDLEAADPHAVRAALTQHEIVVEELGGEVPAIEISALKGTNVDDLLEMISLVAEVEELEANPKAPAIGTVIEAQLEVGRGPIATVVVQRGTLKRGDALAAGPVPGRVRAMFNDQGEQVKEAGPSTPVVVMGWDEVPTAGDMFEVVKNERAARKIAQSKLDDLRSKQLFVPSAIDRLGMLVEQLPMARSMRSRIRSERSVATMGLSRSCTRRWGVSRPMMSLLRKHLAPSFTASIRVRMHLRGQRPRRPQSISGRSRSSTSFSATLSLSSLASSHLKRSSDSSALPKFARSSGRQDWVRLPDRT